MFTSEKNQTTENGEALEESTVGFVQNSEESLSDDKHQTSVSDDELLGYLWERSFL